MAYFNAHALQMSEKIYGKNLNADRWCPNRIWQYQSQKYKPHETLWGQTDWLVLCIYFVAGNMTFICMGKTHVCKVSGQKSTTVMEKIQLQPTKVYAP